MGLENLSQRQRFWLFVVLTTVSMLALTFIPQFFNKDQKAKQVVASGPVPQATDTKKDTAPVQKPEDVAKKEPEKTKEKPAEPVVSKTEAINKLLAQQGPEKQHTLGDDNTKIQVVFSDRGAAVRSMTLNDHEASDRQTGKRLAADANGQRPKLTLVNDDEDKNRNTLSPARQLEHLSYRLSLLNEKQVAPPELEALPWKQQDGANGQQVSYVALVPSQNLKITKRYTLAKDEYHVSLELQFDAIDSSKPAKFSYELTGPRGTPVEGLRWKQFSFRSYVFVTQDFPDDTTNNNNRPLNTDRTLEGVEKLNKDGTPRNFTLNAADPKEKKVFLYGGVMIQFFSMLAIVDHAEGEQPMNLIDKVQAEYIGPDADSPEYYKDRQGRLTTRLISLPVILEKGKTSATHKYLLYAGPSKSMLLKYEKGIPEELVDRYTRVLQLDQLTDASDITWTNFFKSARITSLLVASTNLMHGILEFLHKYLGNFGIAIIAMTVLVRLCLFPLSRKQAQNQAKMQEQMKLLRPDMDKIKKQYANDRQAYALAQMELYKKHNVSMLAGCNGCWIVFLQMPIFLGLYFALRESIHLRLAGFLWIDNLAMPDMLLHWGDNFLTNLPISFLYLGPYLHILPIVSVTVMYMYQKLMAPPAMDEQQEQQIKMMNYMTLVMGLAFYWVASGLCLYFIVSSVWGMVERKFVKKAKDQAIAQWQEKRERDKSPTKTTPGVRSKLGDMWRDLQSKADKRK